MLFGYLFLAWCWMVGPPICSEFSAFAMGHPGKYNKNDAGILYPQLDGVEKCIQGAKNGVLVVTW